MLTSTGYYHSLIFFIFLKIFLQIYCMRIILLLDSRLFHQFVYIGHLVFSSPLSFPLLGLLNSPWPSKMSGSKLEGRLSWQPEGQEGNVLMLAGATWPWSWAGTAGEMGGQWGWWVPRVLRSHPNSSPHPSKGDSLTSLFKGKAHVFVFLSSN